MDNIDKAIEKAIAFFILIVLVVPILHLTLKEFTDTGGIIEAVGTTFEVGIWRFWPLMVLFIALIFVARMIGNRIGNGGNREG